MCVWDYGFILHLHTHAISFDFIELSYLRFSFFLMLFPFFAVPCLLFSYQPNAHLHVLSRHKHTRIRVQQKKKKKRTKKKWEQSVSLRCLFFFFFFLLSILIFFSLFLSFSMALTTLKEKKTKYEVSCRERSSKRKNSLHDIIQM